MECFNCFQRGFCEYGVRSLSGKVLNFCSEACAQVQKREHALHMVEENLRTAAEALKNVKTKNDQFKIPVHKLIFTRVLLFKALMAEKPKKELNRLFDLFKDQLIEMLSLIGDKSTEIHMLVFAEKMKQINEYLPILIQLLGK